jgi:hypothetical protein
MGSAASAGLLAAPSASKLWTLAGNLTLVQTTALGSSFESAITGSFRMTHCTDAAYVDSGATII